MFGSFGTGSGLKTGASGGVPTSGTVGVGGDVIGGIIGGIGTITDAALDYAAQQKQLEFEKQQLAYQKKLQALLMSREDSAMQRRVIDLQAAGLSPVLAAGGSGASAGPVVSTVTPSAPTLRTGIAQLGPQVLNMMKQKADIASTTAQQELIQQQIKESKSRTNLNNVNTFSAGIDANIQAETNQPKNGGVLSNMIKSLTGAAKSKLGRIMLSNEELVKYLQESWSSKD